MIITVFNECMQKYGLLKYGYFYCNQRKDWDVFQSLTINMLQAYGADEDQTLGIPGEVI